MIKEYYLPPEDITYRDFLRQKYPELFHDGEELKTLTFQVTEDCCLQCTYCYQKHNSYHKMDFNIIKPFLNNLLEDKINYINTSNTNGVIFEFIGGEPFLEIKLITQICDYLIWKMIKLDHPWLNFFKISLSSNGLLYFNSDVQNFLCKYKDFISLGITLDGNKQLHDACRIDLFNHGSYDRVLKAVLQYKKDFQRMPGIKITICKDNVQYLYDSIISIINLGYTAIHANCVFEEGWTVEDGKIFYSKLKKIADYLIQSELYNKIYFSLFEEDCCHPMDESNNHNWCGGVSSAMLAVDYKGDLYPCIRYMDTSLQGQQDPLIIGDIYNGIGNSTMAQNNLKKLQNITRRSQSTDECFNCPIAQGCAWCSGYNYQKTGTPNKRVTYICPMHKARALANVYFWNTLYNKLNINKKFHNYLNSIGGE